MLVEPSHPWTPAQKLRIAAAVVVGIFSISALVYGYQRYYRAKPVTGIERVEELGSGFRRVTIAKFNKAELGHYPFFYYRDRLLCQIGVAPPSISPSGNFAICQDTRSGKLILFRRRDEKIIPLTSTSFGLASGFVWHEEEGTVEAGSGKDGISAIFSLR